VFSIKSAGLAIALVRRAVAVIGPRCDEWATSSKHAYRVHDGLVFCRERRMLYTVVLSLIIHPLISAT
jgi:hypothetical protein